MRGFAAIACPGVLILTVLAAGCGKEPLPPVEPAASTLDAASLTVFAPLPDSVPAAEGKGSNEMVTKNRSDQGVFKVPSLRNIGKTAPYFHDGAAAGLDQAVRDMAEYQMGKTLSDQETKQIVSFLNVLTGTIDPEYIVRPVLPKSTAATPKPDER